MLVACGDSEPFRAPASESSEAVTGEAGDALGEAADNSHDEDSECGEPCGDYPPDQLTTRDVCPLAYDFDCDVPPTCGGSIDCGALARFDESGCPRPPCLTNDDCPESQRCHLDSCGDGLIRCPDSEGSCGCSWDDSCDEGNRGYCVESDAGP